MDAVIQAYRVEVLAAPEERECGVRYTLEPPELDPERYQFEVLPIQVSLARAVRVAESGMGRPLLYREHDTYGLNLETALRMGVCWLADSEGKSEDSAPEAG